jgi:hypothetical protein
MSSNRPPDADAGDSPRFEESDEQAYFRRIEEVFVGLRGAPLLLSPKDWQLVRGWYTQGVPLDLIVRTLEVQFEARRERGSSNTVSSLRYFQRAIDKVWDEVRQLTQDVAQRREVEPLSLEGRLQELAERLPDDLVDVEEWRRRICALEGTSDVVESALEDLDDELLASLRQRLDDTAATEMGELVATRLQKLKTRLPDDQLESARQRLFDRALRERFEVPVLSLFVAD